MTSSVCPEVTFSCLTENLQSSILRWFINDEVFATYAISPNHQYPLSLMPENETYSALLGGVDIQIVTASSNEDQPDIITSIQSTMTVNISALQVSGVTNVSCGLTNTRSYVNITFNSSSGKFITATVIS